MSKNEANHYDVVVIGGGLVVMLPASELAS